MSRGTIAFSTRFRRVFDALRTRLQQPPFQACLLQHAPRSFTNRPRVIAMIGEISAGVLFHRDRKESDNDPQEAEDEKLGSDNENYNRVRRLDPPDEFLTRTNCR